MNDDKNRISRWKRNGVPLTLLNRLGIALALILAVIMIYATVQTDRSFESMQSATDRYITCQADAVLFQEGSDFLTNSARSYAVTGDKQYADAYAEEVEVTRRRERTLDDADLFQVEEESLKYLNEALKHSNALADVECYAMRLAAQSMGADLSNYPAMISQVELSPEHAALSPDRQREIAVDLLFNSDYADMKEQIYANVQGSIQTLIDDTRQQMEDSTARLNQLLRRQQVLVFLLLCTVLAIVLLISSLIIRPLRKNIRSMDQGKAMRVSGASEIRHLAVVYNDVLEDNNEKHEELSYSATHDALTGLYNRAAYDEAYRTFKHEDICVLVVDVDKFKQINDTYGHDGGDRALKKVSATLQAAFRADDHISRIGGDEFCVIMKHMNSDLSQLVVDKVERMNQTLGVAEENLPAISLSVGIAFADRQNPTDDIFKDADTALYRVKEAGRGHCAIYS